MSFNDHPFFASAAPGLDFIVVRELATLGFKPRIEAGGAFWKGEWKDLYRACLGLRSASTVLVRIKGTHVTTFAELEAELKTVPWDRWVNRGAIFRIDATCKASALYHEGAVEERLADWIVKKTGGTWAGQRSKGAEMGTETSDSEPDADEPSSAVPQQRFVVRIINDQLQLSIDACGSPLHRRGYRLALAKAPLRETLAAGLLLGSGWVPAVEEGLGRGAWVRFKAPSLALDDPFCGSGTIAIEAALIARRIPPALANPELRPRAFACQAWHDFDSTAWNKTVESFRSHVLAKTLVSITAGDRDEGAVRSARANAGRAGVETDIEFRTAAFSASNWQPGSFVVTNPPWGQRVSEGRDLRDLYASFGAKIKASLTGGVCWLDGTEQGAQATGLRWDEVFRSNNGGLPVRALRLTQSEGVRLRP